MKTYEQIMNDLDKCEQIKGVNDRLKQKRFTQFDSNSNNLPHEEIDFNEENEYVS